MENSKYNIVIKNTLLREYIETVLDKKNIQKDDLKLINEIVLNSENIVGEYNKVYIDEIGLFPNLNEIIIKNLGLSEKDMEKLKKINRVKLINCEIDGILKLENVKELTINNTQVFDFENLKYLKNIEVLKLINLDIKDFSFIEFFKNLKELDIENVQGFELKKIDMPLMIEKLSIGGIDCLDLEIIYKFEKLKELSVDGKDAEKIKNELRVIKGRNIRITLNNIYEYEE